jgi:hypothetical protein
MEPLSMIRAGYYTLDMQSCPVDPLLGWTVGTGRKVMHVDLLIAARRRADAANDDELRVPVPTASDRCQAAFNFHSSTGSLYVRKLSRDTTAPLSVDAHDFPFGRAFTLNHARMAIGIRQLKFVLDYTDAASNKRYVLQRQAYMGQHLGVAGARYVPCSNAG